jgi:hypothetical protein
LLSPAPTLTVFFKVEVGDGPQSSWRRRCGRPSGAAQEIGLFRYALIRPVADPALTTRQRGPLVRQLADQDHLGPCGDRVRVSQVTLDRWIRADAAGRRSQNP